MQYYYRWWCLFTYNDWQFPIGTHAEVRKRPGEWRKSGRRRVERCSKKPKRWKDDLFSSLPFSLDSPRHLSFKTVTHVLLQQSPSTVSSILRGFKSPISTFSPTSRLPRFPRFHSIPILSMTGLQTLSDQSWLHIAPKSWLGNDSKSISHQSR